MKWILPSLLLVAATACGQDFKPREFSNPHGKRLLRYQLYIPENYDARIRYPMILWLHDVLGVGNDNRRQIEHTNRAGSHVWIQPENQATHPAFVLAPQCPTGTLWVNLITRRPSRKLRLVLGLIEELQREYSIDSDRLYVAGQSLGGFAVWSLLAARPDRFAAAVPVSGGGKPSQAGRFVRVPIWAFHGGWDPVVPVRESRRMIDALHRAGGSPRYTELAGGGHTGTFWTEVFEQPGLVEWLFAQRR